ncbi:MAG: tRNA 2-thiouridine(34) synthase MnmA [Bacteroidota bacterium]|nr:tRNA 2-thiouridine(34) synthase MnmA [Bacteroidota bacterium]
MNSNTKVLMAMSGGIDSSVAAMLLREQGYQVIGITMKTWDFSSNNYSSRKETGCCSLDSINDAREVAVKYGFPHYVLDFRNEFNELIVNNFIEEYLAGHTPNPCVRCNTFIKWDALLKKADLLGCDFIATGHYVKIRHENSRYIISKGKDDSKDQSYVLWGLTQENLKRTLFPLGNYLKSDIREIARKNGFDNLAKKRESYEICFIPDNNYRCFLENNIQNFKEKYPEGVLKLIDGKILGTHKGYPNYTIGQRKGLEVAVGYPIYVVDIDPVTNTVTLGKKDDLLKQELFVKDFNPVKFTTFTEPLEVLTKIRYKDKGTYSSIEQYNNQIKVTFFNKVSAITPGQSAVFYDGDDVVGGGVIV